ncbi:ricin-type beta-trefoil lectin domain protein [Streptomyces sp. NPDC091377]|uniref:ricin-type beta-trefoil lectin domain protein n=1 Tax=Streptomyces sp. NPDC091377 TaxID=3365995 RepID=UPI0037FFFCB4
MLPADPSDSPDLVPHRVGELLDRHWEAAFAYARLCTDGSRAAGMLTTAAFTRQLGAVPPRGDTTPTWRYVLLLTVRDLAAEWATGDRRALLAPALRRDNAPGPPAPLLPPSERRLLTAAFHRLPEPARCLLWHTAAESDPLTTPAALLGLDETAAALELRRARERLRAECVQAHHDLAPSPRCRHFSRMLDVTYRRGGTPVDPDLATHLDACPHCRHAADQLGRFPTELGTLLAEAVLGWAARPYVTARAARFEPAADPPAADLPPRPDGPAFMPPPPTTGTAPTGPAPTGPAPTGPAPTGEPYTSVPPATRGPRPPAPRVLARRAAARRRGRAAAFVTVGALVAVPLGLWAAGDSGEGMPVAAQTTPDTDRPGPGPNPSGIDAAAPPEKEVRGRLRNAASGLCLTPADGEVTRSARTELAVCSGSPAQQWSYETDGLLRSVADPGLCVDSSVGHSVRLDVCADIEEVRYDLTRRGALVPRWDQGLTLAPAATDGSGALTVKPRDDGRVQRWEFDPGPDLRTTRADREDTGTASPDDRPAPARDTAASPEPSKPPRPSPTERTPGPRQSPCRPDGDRDHRPDRDDGEDRNDRNDRDDRNDVCEDGADEVDGVDEVDDVDGDDRRDRGDRPGGGDREER